MAIDAPNHEEVGKEDRLYVYEKVWGASAYQISIAMPQRFRVENFLESLNLRHDRAVELLKNMCADVSADRICVNEGLLKTNIC